MRLLYSPDDPIIPSAPPEPPPSGGGRSRGYIKCDHCGCQLTQTGEVFRMSTEARAHLKSTEKISELEGTIETLRAEIEELKARPVPSAEPLPERKSGLLTL